MSIREVNQLFFSECLSNGIKLVLNRSEQLWRVRYFIWILKIFLIHFMLFCFTQDFNLWTKIFLPTYQTCERIHETKFYSNLLYYSLLFHIWHKRSDVIQDIFITKSNEKLFSPKKLSTVLFKSMQTSNGIHF